MIPVPELQNMEAIFGSIKHMPKYEDVPEQFKDQDNEFAKLQRDWFFRGLNAKKLLPKDGVDKRAALKALMAIQGSFEPKHEHKAAAVAYLLSEWFTIDPDFVETISTSEEYKDIHEHDDPTPVNEDDEHRLTTRDVL